MSQKHFQQGLVFYKKGEFQQALEQFNKAIDNGKQDNYMMLDTRAAVYSKLGETKKAMKDAKRTIEVAPDQWQGYSRAAQLFLAANKPEASLTMVRLGLSKLRGEHADRRVSLLALETRALAAQEELERQRRKNVDQMGKLPIELFGEIARMVVQDNHTAVIGLSQVSKHWREVVHSCHFLWDTLRLDRRRPKHKAKAWIERSKGKLRELSVHKDVHDDPAWPDQILSGVRWEDLRVLKHQCWDLQNYLHRIGKSDSLHSLESLDLDGVPTIDSFLLPSTNLPNLRHFALRYAIGPRDVFQDLLCFQNLLSITFECIPFVFGTASHDFFQAQSQLQSLVLHDLGFTLNITSPMAHLTCLDVKLFSRTLQLSQVPALQILRLEAVSKPSLILETVKESRANLTELIIRSCAADSSLINDILFLSPNLQTLEVSNTEAARVLQYLNTPPPLPDNTPEPAFVTSWFVPHCPNLTHVNFSKCFDVQTGPIVRLIRTRLSNLANVGVEPKVQPIASLVINECHNVDASWLAWMRSNVKSVSCVYMTKKAKFRGA